MTLFVDCSGSKFYLSKEGEFSERNIFKRDREIVEEHFKNTNFNAFIFKNVPDIGNGFILFKNEDVDDSKTFLIHIRCTSQDSKSQSILLKLGIIPKNSFFEGAKTKAKQILDILDVKLNDKSVLKSISSGRIQKLIAKMDSDLNLNRFKFGIGYLDRFDTSEQQMLANTIEDSSESVAFNNFLAGIGDQISLKGWKAFSGGLDVSAEGLTGDLAIYKKCGKSKSEEVEIIYHVAPWLPQSENHDSNNLERKRHFGNDTIVIIFSESLYAFELQTLLSQQIQVVIFVRYINRLQKYQVYIYSKLPNFVTRTTNPFYISSEGEFERFTELLIDYERQCYNMLPLIEKLYFMRKFHLQQITNKN